MGSPNVKIFYDIYHMQIMRGNVTAFIRENLPHSGHFDVAGVPGRHEPDSGELNYPFLMREIDRLGWVARIGTLVGPAPSGADTLAIGLNEALVKGSATQFVAALKARSLLPAGNSTDPAKERYESSTGDIVLDAHAGVLKVNTPRTVVLAGPAGSAATLGPVTVRIAGSWACVFLTSLDGAPLAESSHVLVGHLTDMRNTGQTFRDRSMEVLDSFGGAPRLVRAGTATVRLSGSRRLDAFRLAPDGARSGKVGNKQVKGAVEFTASTATKPDATLFYELVAPAGKAR